MQIAGLVDLGASFVTDQPADVLERRIVGDARTEQLRPVIVEHCLGAVAEDRLDLCEVLPDRHQGDAVTSSR